MSSLGYASSAQNSPSFSSAYASSSLSPVYSRNAVSSSLSSSSFSSTGALNVCVVLSSSSADIKMNNIFPEAELGISYECLQLIHNILSSEGYMWQIATLNGDIPVISNEGNSCDDFDLHESSVSIDSSTNNTLNNNKSNNIYSFIKDENVLRIVKNPIKISLVDVDNYKAILIPHHLGPCLDLFHCEPLGNILHSFLKKNKIICAIGYGVFGLCAPSSLSSSSNKKYAQSPAYENEAKKSAFSSNNNSIENSIEDEDKGIKEWLFRGRLITGVSVFDEYRHPYFGKLPHILQDVVDNSGGNFVSCLVDTQSVVIENNLITAPNHISTKLCLQNLCWLAKEA